MFGFLGIKDPEHVAMLMKALNAYCQAHDIARECPERLEVARRLVKLFESGARTPEALQMGLALTAKLDRLQGHSNHTQSEGKSWISRTDCN
jgi:hypothetical protein